MSGISFWTKYVVKCDIYSSFFIDDPFICRAEVDGLSIQSLLKREFLQKVPQQIDEVFRIGSTNSAALLFDAHDLYEQRNPKADETIRLIKKDLLSAIQICIEAALNEFDISLQKKLLRAANFGRAYLTKQKVVDFRQSCQYLRVLNALRTFEVGICPSYEQYISHINDQI